MDSSLTFANIDSLVALGVDGPRYGDRNYQRTQEISDAAFFLGFDGIVAPSARWSCANAIIFTERAPLDLSELLESEPSPIDWPAWQRRRRV